MTGFQSEPFELGVRPMRLPMKPAPRRKRLRVKNYIPDAKETPAFDEYTSLNFGAVEPMTRRRRNDEGRTWACR